MHRTSTAGLAAWIAAGVLCSFAPGATARGLGPPAELQALVDSLMASEMAKHHIPGGVLVAVQGTEVRFARGYGFADLEHRTPVDPERTIFRVASVSKLVTATAVMQLVERGQLSLDADVNQYLKRFQIAPAYGAPVTLRQLLTHTGGFDDRNIDRKSLSGTETEPLGDYLARRMPARIQPPGRYLSYSNHGMALVGFVVEEVSGRPFAQFVHDHLFTPLGMKYSSFAAPAVPADLAQGYDDSDPPRPVPADFVKTVPASMMTTTGADMARFAIAHLNGGSLGAERILDGRLIQETHRRQFTQDSMLPGIGLGFWERFQNGERALWHDGDGAGFASLLYLLPEHDTGLFLVFNGEGGNAAREAILKALLDRYFPDQRPAVTPVPFAGAAAEARRCAGLYVHNRYGHLGIERLVSLMNQIELRPDSGSTLEGLGDRYVAIAPLRFQRAHGRGLLVFEADARGRVVRMFTGGSIARVHERLPWHELVRVQLGVVAAIAAVFVTTVMLWPLVLVVGRTRRGIRGAGLFRRGEIVAIAIAALGLMFLIGFGAYLAKPSSPLQYGIPPPLIALFTIPILTVLLTVVLLIEWVRKWKDPAESLRSQLHFSLISVTAVGYLLWLAEWNLLGYRF
jgi:CubicO group peptidase (beta-lactamase class C family)